MKKITIDNIELIHPVLLAPMTGVSDLPFRRLVKKFGVGMVVSEMIASKAMILQTKNTLRMVKREEAEYPMAVQLAGCDPQIMAEAAKLNEDMGADIIDINFGCPVKKVVNSYAGSALMKNIPLATEILQAVVKSVKIPVTMKMRMGWDYANLNAPEIAHIAEDVGIKMLTIHGRTRSQMYKGKANWQFISKVKEMVKIPIIANGDINNISDVDMAMQESKADGVMIGRGSYGRPWFLSQVCSHLSGEEVIDIPKNKAEIILEHFNDMLETYGEIGGIRIARKHLGWYSSGHQSSAEFRRNVNKMQEVEQVRDYVSEFFE